MTSTVNSLCAKVILHCDFGLSETKVDNRERNVVQSLLVNPNNGPRLPCETHPLTANLELCQNFADGCL